MKAVIYDDAGNILDGKAGLVQMFTAYERPFAIPIKYGTGYLPAFETDTKKFYGATGPYAGEWAESGGGVEASTGGNGIADAGKALLFSPDGSVKVTEQISITSSTGFTTSLLVNDRNEDRDIVFPASSGTVLVAVSDIAGIDAVSTHRITVIINNQSYDLLAIMTP